jgi:ABC-type bacteriocin/lantibiotic exporter with double-glycine peptidase domain
MNNNGGMTPLARLFSLLREEKNQVYAIYFYAVLNGIVTLSLPLGIQAILNFILGGRITTSWIILVIIVALGVAFGGFLQISQLQISEKLQQRIFSKAGLAMAYRLPRVKTEVLHGEYGPEIVNRFFDIVSLQKGIAKLLTDFSTAFLQVFFGLLLLTFYHPTFILFGIVLISILSLIFYLTGPKGMETALKESTYKYQTAYWLQEVGRTMNTFKLVGNTRLPILRADKLIQKYVEFRRKHFSVLILQFKVMIVFKILIVTSLLVAGSLLLINDQISIGQFVAAEVIIVIVVNAVEKLILSLETVYDTLVSAEKLGHVMDLELEHNSETEKVVISQPEGLQFSLENVTFQPADALKSILKDVSLNINPGSKVVINGESGSGKSALLALLSGIYEEYGGKVNVNNLSMEMIQLEKFRAMVGDCLETQQIFHGSIKENILVGRDFNYDQLDYILDLVDLKDYIYQLPTDLETILMPEGKGLSRKIAQSILLARAFLGDPKALIMENSLSDLEEPMKTSVTEFIFSGNWTLVLTSKEEKIIAKASQVIYLEKGTLLYNGNFEGYKLFRGKNF